MFKVKTDIDSIKKLDKHIEMVKKISSMKEDKTFQKYIQDKCMQALEQVMNSRLQAGSTTNDDSINLYKSSNHLLETDDGFIIYNDAKIPANVSGVQNDISNYPNGEFSIALAFEYGVGLVGMNTINPNAWEYNVNNYFFGWVLPQNVLGEKGIRYMGYTGFEVYRYTAIEIQTQLPKWVNDYFRSDING